MAEGSSGRRVKRRVYKYNKQNAMEDDSEVCADTMRDYAESQGANSDENSSLHNEEEKPSDPDYVEERFRVDRRKLEHMIQGW